MPYRQPTLVEVFTKAAVKADNALDQAWYHATKLPDMEKDCDILTELMGKVGAHLEKMREKANKND